MAARAGLLDKCMMHAMPDRIKRASICPENDHPCPDLEASSKSYAPNLIAFTIHALNTPCGTRNFDNHHGDGPELALLPGRRGAGTRTAGHRAVSLTATSTPGSKQCI
jgi:hypothetical protein